MACITCSGQVYSTNPTETITCSGQNYSVTLAGGDYSSGIGTGSSSGVALLDSAGGFVQDLGSTVSNIIGKIQGPQITRLPNGQLMLPNGQLLGAVPMATGSGNLLIIAAAVILIVLLMSSRK